MRKVIVTVPTRTDHEITIGRTMAMQEDEGAAHRETARKRALANLWQAYATYKEYQEDHGDVDTFLDWVRDELPDLMPATASVKDTYEVDDNGDSCPHCGSGDLEGTPAGTHCASCGVNVDEYEASDGS